MRVWWVCVFSDDIVGSCARRRAAGAPTACPWHFRDVLRRWYAAPPPGKDSSTPRRGGIVVVPHWGFRMRCAIAVSTIAPDCCGATCDLRTHRRGACSGGRPTASCAPSGHTVWHLCTPCACSSPRGRGRCDGSWLVRTHRYFFIESTTSRHYSGRPSTRPAAFAFSAM